MGTGDITLVTLKAQPLQQKCIITMITRMFKVKNIYGHLKYIDWLPPSLLTEVVIFYIFHNWGFNEVNLANVDVETISAVDLRNSVEAVIFTNTRWQHVSILRKQVELRGHLLPLQRHFFYSPSSYRELNLKRLESKI